MREDRNSHRPDEFLWATDGGERIHDPVANAGSITTATHGLYTGSGSQFGTVTVQQPASASLIVSRGERHVSSTTAPVHRFRDPHTDHTYLEVQYSNDPEDGYARVEVSPHPGLPHRGSAEKFHPSSVETIVASASSGLTNETTSGEWPDLY